jgi:hypothetical protein
LSAHHGARAEDVHVTGERRISVAGRTTDDRGTVHNGVDVPKTAGKCLVVADVPCNQVKVSVAKEGQHGLYAVEKRIGTPHLVPPL